MAQGVAVTAGSGRRQVDRISLTPISCSTITRGLETLPAHVCVLDSIDPRRALAGCGHCGGVVGMLWAAIAGALIIAVIGLLYWLRPWVDDHSHPYD